MCSYSSNDKTAIETHLSTLDCVENFVSTQRIIEGTELHANWETFCRGLQQWGYTEQKKIFWDVMPLGDQPFSEGAEPLTSWGPIFEKS